MNDNLNDIIWEEKNSTEPQKNYENKSVLETKDTTNDIQKSVESLHWKDITDPKLRKKMRCKAYYDANQEKRKIYLNLNKDKIKQQKKSYNEVNKEKVRLQTKSYRESNKEKIKVRTKDYRKSYYQKNKEEIIKKRKVYVEKNKEKVKKYHTSYCNRRFKTDSNYKLACNLRSRLKSAINGNFKSGSAVKDLGCSIEELKQYLESKFLPGMSWDNHTVDGWHIDHIKPLASFDLTDRQQFLEACHYTNLQPLWAKDNISKGDNISVQPK